MARSSIILRPTIKGCERFEKRLKLKKYVRTKAKTEAYARKKDGRKLKRKNAIMVGHDSVFWRIQEGSNLRPAA